VTTETFRMATVKLVYLQSTAIYPLKLSVQPRGSKFKQFKSL